MDLFVRSVIVLLVITCNLVTARRRKPSNGRDRKKLFDQIYDKLKNGRMSNNVSYPNRRFTQLYSRNSGNFIQVLPPGRVVAKGQDGDKYAALEIITNSFGTVRIKAVAVSRYICFDRRGRLKTREQPKENCIFREQRDKEAYTVYSSKYKDTTRFLAFNANGVNKHKANYSYGTPPVQFVERPRSEAMRKKRKNPNYYQGKKVPKWLMSVHKKRAEKNKRLGSQTKVTFKPLHDGKRKRRNRKNRHKKRLHSSRKSNESERFPPRKRFGSKDSVSPKKRQGRKATLG